MIIWSFERGWDPANSGIYYFLDAISNKPPIALEWEMKLWWPINEAMIGYSCLLEKEFELGGGGTRADEYLGILEKVVEYGLKKFSDPKYGGWFGYLTKEGRVNQSTKGQPYKGFFHVPRALLYTLEVLERVRRKIEGVGGKGGLARSKL